MRDALRSCHCQETPDVFARRDRFVQIARFWQALQQPQLTADEVTTRTKMRLMLALIAQLQPLMEQITAYGEEITRLFFDPC